MFNMKKNDRPTPAPIPQSADPDIPSGMVTILIADDSPSIRESIAYVMRKNGFDTLEAANGKECLDLLATHDINLLVLDLEMPVLGGRDVLKRIRSSQKHKELPVFIYSGLINDVRHIKDKELEKMATLIFCKPLNLNELKEFVHLYV